MQAAQGIVKRQAEVLGGGWPRIAATRRAVPPAGIEPATYGLQNRCSTVELQGRLSANGAKSLRHRWGVQQISLPTGSIDFRLFGLAATGRRLANDHVDQGLLHQLV